MTVTLAVSGADGEAQLRSLADWLEREDGLDGVRIDAVTPSVEPGRMGALSDALLVTLGSGSAGAVLARSIVVWLGTRTSDVTVKITHAKGSVQLNARRVRDPEAMLREVQKLFDEPDTGLDEPA